MILSPDYTIQVKMHNGNNYMNYADIKLPEDQAIDAAKFFWNSRDYYIREFAVNSIRLINNWTGKVIWEENVTN